MTTVLPACSSCRRFGGSGREMARASTRPEAGTGSLTTILAVTGCSSRSASTMAAMCCGPIPQQPPMSRAPSAARSRAAAAKYSGEVK